MVARFPIDTASVRLLALAASVWLVGLRTNVQAEQVDRTVQVFLKTFCVDCHSGNDSKAGLRLDELEQELNEARNLRNWVKVFDRVAANEMPPQDAKQPAVDQRQAILKSLQTPLLHADLQRQRREGRTVLRRLNRVEYEFTLRDLLALPQLELKDLLPADTESHGFDTVGEAQSISYVQQAAYLKGAETALLRATALFPKPKEQHFQFGFADPPPPNPTRVYPPKPWHGLAMLSNANLDPPSFMRNTSGAVFMAMADGMYRIRFRARGATYDSREQGGGQEGKVTDSEVPHVILLYAERPPFSRWIATFDLPCDRVGELNLSTWLNAGEKIRRIHASIHESGQTYRPFEKPFFGTVIGLDHFEARGPFWDEWPPPSHRRLFGDVAMKELPRTEIAKLKPTPGVPLATLQLAPSDPLADAERLIADFLPRAFRRRAPDSEVQRYTKIAHQQLAANNSFQEAMFAAYQAALSSPDFLYFQESPGQLDGEALANRLSYFLWRSLPDDELLQLARTGELLQPQTLRNQVERLLKDERSERFVADFTDLWLKLRELAFTQADSDLYPEYHEDFELLDSLPRETRAYFAEMLRHDLGVSFVVDSDFVFINRRLAKLYEIPGVEGTEIRKVPIPKDHVRGGLLTQASVLKVTANGTTTSPVTRGVWLMDRILGSPPPPPPSDVPAIEPDIRGATTIRELLAKHREDAACAICHRRIDPPGFALECFDVLGGYRTRYRSLGGKPLDATVRRVKVKYNLGPAVETHGETETGYAFKNLHEYQQNLLADQPRLARNLLERLVTFSTGAPVQFADRPEIEAMVQQLAEKQFGLRSMIHAVVQSRMFQNK